jgi:hypothetical protein
MNAAYIIDNVCKQYLVCENLEQATSFIPSLFSEIEDTSLISVIDAADSGCLVIGYVKASDNNWYHAGHPKIAGWPVIRMRRDSLLALSDWTQLSDSPLSEEEKTQWATYRQTLRDVTTSFTNAWDATLPEDPTGNNAIVFNDI